MTLIFKGFNGRLTYNADHNNNSIGPVSFTDHFHHTKPADDVLHLHDDRPSEILFGLQRALHNGQLHRARDDHAPACEFELSGDAGGNGDTRLSEHLPTPRVLY